MVWSNQYRVSHFSLERAFFQSVFAGKASMICSGRNLFPDHVIGMEFSLYCFPDDASHAPSFLGQDTDVLKLDVVTQVYAVFSHS